MFDHRNSQGPQNTPKQEVAWSTLAQVVTAGFDKSSVVMVNEAHEGALRCIRTREVGVKLIFAAHSSGCRSLAVEALGPGDVEVLNSSRIVPTNFGGPNSYLRQPDMQLLLQTALDMGWNLIEYEADLDKVTRCTTEHGNMAGMNLREELQAQNLAKALKQHMPLLVWCGNSHNSKVEIGDWTPMAVRFQKLTGIDPFCIDQTKTIKFPCPEAPYDPRWEQQHKAALIDRDGLAAFLTKDGPLELRSESGADAFIFSLRNTME